MTLARWQGVTDAHVAENTRRLNALNGSIERIEGDVSEIKVSLGTLATKIAVWSAAVTVAAGGLVSTIVLILVR